MALDLKELQRRANTKSDYNVELLPSDDAGKSRARVTQDPLDMLYARKVITEDQFNAGDRLRRLHEIGSSSLAVQGYDGTAVSDITYGPKSGFSDKMLEALCEYNRIVHCLDDLVRLPVIIICVYGGSIAAAYEVKEETRAHTRAIGKFQVGLDLLQKSIDSSH